MPRRNRAVQTAALLAVVLAVGAVGWIMRDRLAGLLGDEPVAVAVSPEAADQAEEKLRQMREDREEVSLSDVELSSLLRYRAPAAVLRSVEEPEVRLEGDTLTLSGRVPTDRLPSHPDLDQVRGLLPDTSSVEVTGRLVPLGDGRSALEIEELELAGLPVPRRFYPEVLSRMGRRDLEGLAPNAIALDLPAGVRTARVEGGRLVLTP